jgi:starch synthase/alpha-amylase
LPCGQVHLAEDRAIFYSKPINSNSEWENIRISLVFQREVINQIIPRVQPDLIHCYDWMTGLIPAAADKIGIPCLYTVQKFDSARSLLAFAEDIGIDAAGFWQNLFYDRYPGSYEQTRDTNPLDLLLSGILAASHVNTADPLLWSGIAEGRSDFMNSPLGKLLAQKWNAGCACGPTASANPRFKPTIEKKSLCSCGPKDQSAGNQKNDRSHRQSISSPDTRAAANCYINLYETLLHQQLIALKSKVHPINKNSLTNASGLRAIAFPKARHTKSYPLPNERNSTAAMAPI